MASDAQSKAAKSANATQMAMFDIAQKNLTPYMDAGKGATSALTNLTGTGEGGDPLNSPLLKPISMDEATLQQTPGYQFNLTQGLKATQNAAAARGLGSSGAALKGAATFATGLADSTYQNQFNNALTNQNNQFNRLMGVSQLGANAAANVGQDAITTGQGIASTTVGAGNARAAAWNSGANALGSAGSNYVLMDKYLNTP
jgi:hypothetical protein